MRILTISIAAYNVENLLPKTLDSFIDGRVMEDIEVLIIDDGSKDRTKEVASSYVKNYPGTFRLISKENGGHGSTINRGIKEASGKYFKIVDGDDWVNIDDFAELVKRLKTESAELVLTNLYTVVNETLTETKINHFPTAVYNKEYPLESIPNIQYIAMHNIAVKTEILKTHNVQITEKCFYVDIEFNLNVIAYCNTVILYDLYVYMYRIGQAEQSVAVKSMQKNIQMHEQISLNCIEFYNKVIPSLSEGNRKKELMLLRATRIAVANIRIYLSMKSSSEVKKKIMTFDEKIKKLNSEVYNSSNQFKDISLLRRRNYLFYSFVSLSIRFIKNTLHYNSKTL